jgi:uncharacterized protein YcbX
MQVTGLFIYPVKSCAEQSLASAEVTPRGFAGDRIFQVTHADEQRYLTPRESGCERLFHVQPRLSDDRATLTLRLREGAAAAAAAATTSTTSSTTTTTSTTTATAGDDEDVFLPPLRVALEEGERRAVVMTRVLGVPRPNDNREPLEDYGDAAGEWLSRALPAVDGGCRLSGIGTTTAAAAAATTTTTTASGQHQPAYGRVVMENPKQGEPAGAWPVSLADEAPFLLCTGPSLRDLQRRVSARAAAATRGGWFGWFVPRFDFGIGIGSSAAEAAGAQVDMRRFRPNIVVDDRESNEGLTTRWQRQGSLRPWEEDTWKKIRIVSTARGEGGNAEDEGRDDEDEEHAAEFWVWQRCARCVMTTIDRDGLGRSTEPLATLSAFRERAHGCRNFGVHLVPCREQPPLKQQQQQRQQQLRRSPRHKRANEAAAADADADADAMMTRNRVVGLGGRLEVLEYDEDRRAEWLASTLHDEKHQQREIRQRIFVAAFAALAAAIVAALWGEVTKI